MQRPVVTDAETQWTTKRVASPGRVAPISQSLSGTTLAVTFTWGRMGPIATEAHAMQRLSSS